MDSAGMRFGNQSAPAAEAVMGAAVIAAEAAVAEAAAEAVAAEAVVQTDEQSVPLPVAHYKPL